jgi:hypothetical protein
MSYMNSKGYVNRKHGHGTAKKTERKRTSWWIVKENLVIYIGYVHFPKRLMGKRVRVKIEEV